MLDKNEVKRKLMQMPGDFNSYYFSKRYAAAKRIYETAETVAMFCELPAEDKKYLFGNSEPDDDKPPVWNGFNQEWVRRAYLECIKKNETFDHKTYDQTRYAKKILL